MERNKVTSLYLMNALFRHQLYLDGLKLGVSASFAAYLRRLYNDFARFLLNTQFVAMDDITKGQLERFILQFQQAQMTYFNEYREQLIVILKSFLAEDSRVVGSIFSEPIKTQREQAYLWAQIVDEPIPASGLYLIASLQNFINVATAATVATLRQAWSNNLSMPDTLKAFSGTGGYNYREGLFGKFASQNTALVGNSIQHITSILQSEAASKVTNKYVWMLGIAHKHTEICLSRAGNVYVYGEGPLPPAHYGCVSAAVPIIDEDIPEQPHSMIGWYIGQSKEFQNDTLGLEAAKRLRDGELTAADMISMRTVKPITLTQYSQKINIIVGERNEA